MAAIRRSGSMAAKFRSSSISAGCSAALRRASCALLTNSMARPARLAASRILTVKKRSSTIATTLRPVGIRKDMISPTTMINAKRFADTQQAAEGCAAHIISVLAEAMNGGSDATLAISGGTSPKLMFEVFAKTTFPWERVQLFWVDERGVPPTDAQSNYKLTDDNWLTPGKFPRTNVHRVQAELAPEIAAKLYQDDIVKTFKLKPGERPRFDGIHRGMGPDGHTASLIPG